MEREKCVGWDMKSIRLVPPSVVLALFIVVWFPVQLRPSQEVIASLSALANSAELGDNERLKDLVEEAEKTTRVLQSDAAWERDELQVQAEKNLKRIENEIKQQAKLIKQQAEVQAKEIQAKAAGDANRLLKQAQEETRKIKEENAKRASAAQQKRLQEMLVVVNKAEEGALKIKHEERQRRLAEEIQQAVSSKKTINIDSLPLPTYVKKVVHSGVPVTQEWRDSMFASFDNDSHFIKNIIVQGESPDEAADFVNKFNEQSMWFDSTLRGTQYYHDASYAQVMHKKSIINKLAEAQEKADDIMERFGKKVSLSDSEQQKLRLFVLYDLNGIINKAMGDQSEEMQILPLDDHTIREVVARVADEALGSQLKKRGFITDFVMRDLEPVDRQVFDALQKDMEDIKGALSEEVAKYNALKEQRKNIDQAKTQEALELEIKLRESQMLIAHFQRQLKQAQVEQINATIMRNDLVRQVEARTRDNLEFELKLDDAQQQIAKGKRDTAETERILINHFKPTLEAGERRALEMETELRSSNQTVTKLEKDLGVATREVASQKETIAVQNKMYSELSTRGQVLEELAEQRFNEHEQKMINEKKLHQMKNL